MAHTPAPWRANLHHTQKQGGINHGFVFADSIVPLAAVVLGVEGMSEDEGRANAHLIAGAPDMLAALVAMLGVQDRRQHPLGLPNEGIAGDAAEATAKARAAIAKATNVP